MAKFYGSIGFVITEETSPGVHQEILTEMPYVGNALRESHRWSGGESVNKGLRLSSRISIIADPFAVSNIPAIRYVLWMNVKWAVKTVVIQHPRIILTLGEVYNG